MGHETHVGAAQFREPARDLRCCIGRSIVNNCNVADGIVLLDERRQAIGDGGFFLLGRYRHIDHGLPPVSRPGALSPEVQKLADAGEKIEATDIDLVITPLLAFDKKGYRVGFGKGFYDKLLAQCKHDVIKVGLSFFEAEEKIDDIKQNDIPLDYCITSDTIYSF